MVAIESVFGVFLTSVLMLSVPGHAVAEEQPAPTPEDVKEIALIAALPAFVWAN